jgi:hypothetical protein
LVEVQVEVEVEAMPEKVEEVVESVKSEVVDQKVRAGVWQKVRDSARTLWYGRAFAVWAVIRAFAVWAWMGVVRWARIGRKPKRKDRKHIGARGDFLCLHSRVDLYAAAHRSRTWIYASVVMGMEVAIWILYGTLDRGFQMECDFTSGNLFSMARNILPGMV